MKYAVEQPRSLIHRKKLKHSLSNLLLDDISFEEKRLQALIFFKKALQTGRLEISQRFQKHNQGERTVRELCFLVDQILRCLYDFTIELFQAPDITLSLLAVGGYGRGELCPFSDIDLLFLLPEIQDSSIEKIIEFILYMLWDLGFKLGYAIRTVQECLDHALQDMTIRTGLLESRFLWGNKAQAQLLQKCFRQEIVIGTQAEFVEAKLNERDHRHQKMGDSRYVLEPNLKEGKGALRDLHTLYWIAKYLYDIKTIDELVERELLPKKAALHFIKAQNFFWTVRCHLHYLTNRAEERLTFDLQPEIARRMGYKDHTGTKGVERLMKHYFLIAKEVGDLTRIFCALLEERNTKKTKFRLGRHLNFLIRSNVNGFVLEGNRLNVHSEKEFRDHPIKILEIFHTALTYTLDIHPKALYFITQNLKYVDRFLRYDKEANYLFLEMLTSKKDPEAALRWMSESGVLGRFIPDFGRVIAQIQYDMYHVYTVDEHTIRAIGILHSLEEGKLEKESPAASQVVRKILSRRVLYLALFLHDIAKGRGGDHSLLGAEIALKLALRLGFSAEEAENTAWLVEHHLLMSKFAFKRDIDDPRTLHDFIAIVQSPERLRLLLCLTVCDIRAVGPNVWNNWKANLLRELYYRAKDILSGGFHANYRENHVEFAKDSLRQVLQDLWSKEEIEDYISLGYPVYWTSFDLKAHLRHAFMIKQARCHHYDLALEHRIDHDHSVTEVTLYTKDSLGLFAKIAGSMAICGANIVYAKIVTMTNGMVLDSFLIQDHRQQAFEGSSKISKLIAMLELVISGRVSVEKELQNRMLPSSPRTDCFTVSPRVLMDNKASATHTVIEVNGRDRLGILYDLTSALTQAHVQISSSYISTYGESIVDVFYVKDIFGLKIEHEGKLKQLRQSLIDALQKPFYKS